MIDSGTGPGMAYLGQSCPVPACALSLRTPWRVAGLLGYRRPDESVRSSDLSYDKQRRVMAWLDGASWHVLMARHGMS